MRIGILGGTFDPPHNGHLALAQAALESLALDEVLFVPANRNPLKRLKRQASAKERMEMVRLMIAEKSNMALSDLEIVRGGPSYAVDTLDELQFVRPAEYWFLLGADAAKDIDNWKQPERLLRLCRLGVAVRPPETWENLLSRIRPGFHEKLDRIEMHPLEISSTEIRLRLEKRQQLDAWICPAVLKYIREHRLYEN